jgi:release factor glutamine methyltransferase
MTLAEFVSRASVVLTSAGLPSDSARLDAEVLARSVLRWDRATYFSRRHEPAPPGFETAFDALIARRRRREPTHLLVGIREFWGREFEVAPGVLVPRPETELIVERALEFFPDRGQPLRIADAGTGTGCLAVTLAVELPHALVVASDLSPTALAVAARNAGRHRVADRVRLVRGDFLAPFAGPFDLVVSNPPYVRLADLPDLMPEVRLHEPALALAGGDDGLDAFRVIVRQVGPRLSSGGRVLVEIGEGQAEEVCRLAIDAGLVVDEIARDLQQHPRVACLSAARDPG